MLGWTPTRRSVLKAMGFGGLGAAASMTGVVQTGVQQLQVLPAPRARVDQTFISGHKSVQLHSHSNRVVSQLPWTAPREVFEWYLTHGFQVVALTNLNHFTPVAGLAATMDDPGFFLVVQGEEPSFEPDGAGVRIIDSLGVGISGPVDLGKANRGSSTAEVWTNQAKAIRDVGGLPIAAHPNLTWVATGKDIAESDPGDHPRIFELCNTEPGTNWRGGGGRPSVEDLWDEALTRSRRRILSVAADDSHHFGVDMSKSRRPDEPLAAPGRAWLMVRSEEMTWPDIRRAIEAGDCYSTTGQTGIVLPAIEVSRTGISLTLSEDTTDLGWSTGDHNARLYTTYFIGEGGRVLKKDGSLKPSYALRPGDGRYVRARIEDSDGNLAWTQPAFRR